MENYNPSTLKLCRGYMLKDVFFVDDDPNFCEFVLNISHPYTLNLIISQSFHEASKLLFEKDYDAYIFDAALPDGCGFDLAIAVRKKRGSEIPIIVFCGVYRDGACCKKLKDELAIFYVVDKPVRPDEIEAIFQSLCSKNPLESGIISPSFLELKKRYDGTITEKIDVLQKLIDAIKQSPSESNIIALKEFVKKTCGSASTYGYPAVTERCKSFDRHLTHVLENMNIVHDKNWFEYLDEFWKQVKIDFQHLH